MKEILLDTNIVLDIALQRHKFGKDAKELILFMNGNKNLCYYLLT